MNRIAEMITPSGAEPPDTNLDVDFSCPHVWNVGYRVLMGRCDKMGCGLTGADIQECMICRATRCENHRDAN